MKTVFQAKGAKINKKKKKQNFKDPGDYELSLNKSAKFNFKGQCEFDVSSKNRKLNISSDERTAISNERTAISSERTAISNENREVNILEVNNNRNKKKSKKSKINNDKDFQLSISKKEGKRKEFDVDEEAESIDSGCVEDGSMECLSESLELPTDWAQVTSSLAAEHNFIEDLLLVVPSRPELDISQYIEDGPSPKELEKAKAKKTSDNDKAEKPNHVSNYDRVSNYEELTKRLQDQLNKLKKVRKPDRIKTRREQAKLKTKMKILCNKNKKKNKLANKGPEIEDVKKKTGIQSGDGKLVFSKFDFTESEGSNPKPKKKGKDLQHLLSTALKNKEKVKKLEADDLEHATEVKDKKAWMSSLKRAEGQKVYDDLPRLKKAVKKKEKTKKNSQMKWKKREQKLKQKMKQEDQKRNANIEKYNKKKFEAKKKRIRKKGRIVPGF